MVNAFVPIANLEELTTANSKTVSPNDFDNNQQLEMANKMYISESMTDVIKVQTCSTGNTNISLTMTNSIKTPTANMGFMTIASTKKVLTSNRNSDHGNSWPPILEIFISPEL